MWKPMLWPVPARCWGHGMETRALFCWGGRLSQVWRWEKVCARGLVGALVGEGLWSWHTGDIVGFVAGFCSCFLDKNWEAWVLFATLAKSSQASLSLCISKRDDAGGGWGWYNVSPGACRPARALHALWWMLPSPSFLGTYLTVWHQVMSPPLWSSYLSEQSLWRLRELSCVPSWNQWPLWVVKGIFSVLCLVWILQS